jgi:DNA-binding response OmpR family regulator
MYPKQNAVARPAVVPSTVYVIDDDNETVEVLTDALRMHGCRAEGFTDPTVALARILAGHVPDAIVLDCIMPSMNGSELLEQLRRNEVSVPVVFVTALSAPPFDFDPHDPEAPSLINKPFELQHLLAEIDQRIATRRPPPLSLHKPMKTRAAAG